MYYILFTLGICRQCKCTFLCFCFPSPIVHTSELMNDRGIKQVRGGGEGDETCHSAQMLLQSESFPPPWSFHHFLWLAPWADSWWRGEQKGERNSKSHCLVLCSCGISETPTPTTTNELTIGMPLCRYTYTQEILSKLNTITPMTTKPLH